MTAIATASNHKHTSAGVLAVLMSLISQNVGAAFAKHLFPLAGAGGVTSLRIGLAACLLLLLRRPWRSGLTYDHARSLIIYGAMIGAMSLLIYQAFARIPIGVAVAVEVTGPLTIVLLGSRRTRDFVWLVAAMWRGDLLGTLNCVRQAGFGLPRRGRGSLGNGDRRSSYRSDWCDECRHCSTRA